MKVLSRFAKPSGLAAAEAKVADLRTRATAAAERQAAVVAQLDEARRALDAAAESGEELAPRADAIVALEAKAKAAGLEAGPLAGALRRAEEALADLTEERRIAALDAELAEIDAENGKVRAEAAEAVRVLSAIVEKAYGIDRAHTALLRERNGKDAFSSRSLSEDGEWMLFLEGASGDRPFALAPEDAGKTPPRWSLRINLQLIDPQFAMRAFRAARRAEKAA